MSRTRLALLTFVALLLVLLSGTSQAGAVAPEVFGIESFSSAASEADTSAALRAGSHPYALTTTIFFNHETEEETEEETYVRIYGDPENVDVDLPEGLVVNPTATPVRCTEAQFNVGACPTASAVGLETVYINFFGGKVEEPVYNMAPPPGVAAQLGFNPAGAIPVHLFGSVVKVSGAYHLRASALDIPQGRIIYGTKVTIWGDPSDSSHDKVRGYCGTEPGHEQVLIEEEEIAEQGINPNRTYFCPVEPSQHPLLTMPTACTGQPLSTRVGTVSWQEPGVLATAESSAPAITGCSALDFSPSLDAQPTSRSSDSPTGFHVDVHVPQIESVEGLAEASLRAASVTLPPGMVINPSSADGLQACTSAQVDLEGAAPANCPDAAKVGSVEVDTPLLSDPLTGGVYLAKQQDNPFNSLLAIYIVAESHGALIKLAGHVVADPQTGQLTTTFDNNPQLPFSDFKLNFFGGPRAALRTPSTCGTYTTNGEFTPWSGTAPVDTTDSFAVNSGPNGSACANTAAQQPNQPSFNAGTLTPVAGSYSPFVLKLSRQDGSQEFRSLDTTLSPGLTGKLAGIPYCSEAQIAAAEANSGTAEKQSPSCPLASEVGSVNVGAGAGSSPFYVRGYAYLAGPYKGAPISLAIVTPAVAGPFDLGDVVVRTALYVNETSAQIHAVSDPIPTILAGIPLDVRSIALNMNRPKFTLNPTSCNAMAVLGAATSTLGQTASLTDRFQVGACGALGFKPNLAISLKGATKRSGHPALKAVVTYPKGSYANIARAAVTLPASEFIDNARIGNVCTRPQFAESKCPPSSVLGKATAYTPLLDKPLSGKVYFRANGGERELPDIVADLNGQIHVVLVGAVDAVHRKGSEVSRVRNTFATVPDAPVSKFVLQLKGGKQGLLVNSGNLCKVPNKAIVKLTAQNGKVYDTNPAVANSCGKGKKSRRGTSHR